MPKHSFRGLDDRHRAQTYDREGLRQRFCADCGVLLGEESIPMLVGRERHRGTAGRAHACTIRTP